MLVIRIRIIPVFTMIAAPCHSQFTVELMLGAGSVNDIPASAPERDRAAVLLLLLARQVAGDADWPIDPASCNTVMGTPPPRWESRAPASRHALGSLPDLQRVGLLSPSVAAGTRAAVGDGDGGPWRWPGLDLALNPPRLGQGFTGRPAAPGGRPSVKPPSRTSRISPRRTTVAMPETDRRSSLLIWICRSPPSDAGPASYFSRAIHAERRRPDRALLSRRDHANRLLGSIDRRAFRGGGFVSGVAECECFFEFGDHVEQRRLVEFGVSSLAIFPVRADRTGVEESCRRRTDIFNLNSSAVATRTEVIGAVGVDRGGISFCADVAVGVACTGSCGQGASSCWRMPS